MSLAGILFAEYQYLKSHQKVVYVEQEILDIPNVNNENHESKKVSVENMERLNTDYHINNEATENMQLENVFNSIMEQTRVEN